MRRGGRAAHRLVLAACLGLVASGVGATGALDRDAAFARSQAAIGGELGDHRLTDSEGNTLALSSFRGKPLLVSLVYTSCPDVCSAITRRLREVVDVAREALGADAFSVITVGFDVGVDTAHRMRSYARAQGAGDAGWRFLAGDAPTIEALAEELGFSYVPSARGYDHLAQVSVVDAEQRVYRQVYGEMLAPPAIVEPLKELALGRRATQGMLRGWMDGLRLLCTVYDPASGRYAFDYSVIVAALVGATCLGWLAYFLVGSWREHRRSPSG